MAIKVLFVDVGGVLLTNGWDTDLRAETAAHFSIEPEEMHQRHDEVFNAYECGNISFDDYLSHIIFFKERPFSIDQIKTYIFESSRPYPEAIKRIKAIKARYKAKLVLLSNEGREIAEHRFNKFNFHDFVDFYIVSSFIGIRKPDPAMYKLAIDLCQESPKNILYIDDRPKYFVVAKTFGLRTACLKSGG